MRQQRKLIANFSLVEFGCSWIKQHLFLQEEQCFTVENQKAAMPLVNTFPLNAYYGQIYVTVLHALIISCDRKVHQSPARKYFSNSRVFQRNNWSSRKDFFLDQISRPGRANAYLQLPGELSNRGLVIVCLIHHITKGAVSKGNASWLTFMPG